MLKELIENGLIAEAGPYPNYEIIVAKAQLLMHDEDINDSDALYARLFSELSDALCITLNEEIDCDELYAEIESLGWLGYEEISA